MHADELDLTPELVRGLLAEQLPGWAGLPLARVASAGTDNALFRLGDALLVRMPRIGWAAEDPEREHRWLPALAPHLPVAVPAPLALGRPGLGYPWAWTVNPWIPGHNPVVGALEDPSALALDLAGFIGALRAIPAHDGPPAGRGIPLADRDRATREALAQLGDELDAVALAAVTRAWDDALRLPAATSPPAWLHGDMSPGNLLLVDGRLGAVIDFGAFGVGDPAVDQIVAWNLLPSGARDRFRTALGSDDAAWLRGRGWALSIALIALPYYRDTNPALAASSRHVIREVLLDAERG